MRRRAMSHNIKRLPRSLHQLANKALKRAKHRNKAPSRKWRRRPSRILKKINRQNRRHSWLATHIWHAKRFRIADLWGYRVPLRSYQKGFRPTYRDSIKSTVVIDQSYLQCIQIVSEGGPQEIINSLISLCSGSTSLTFANKSSMDGFLEASTLIYTPNQYPHDFLCPARFSWSTNRNPSQLQLWIHPSAYSTVLNHVLKLTHAKENEETREDESSKESKYVMNTPKQFRSPTLTISELRHQMTRIQLIGPRAIALLKNILQLVSDEELGSENLINDFGPSHTYWKNISRDVQPGNLQNGTIISLLIEDPRIFRVSRKQESKKPASHFSEETPPQPCSLFWDSDFRNRQLSKRLSAATITKNMSESLGGLKFTPYKVPILLIIRKASQNSSSTAANRVDLLAPVESSLDLWLSIQFANGRAAGLQDKIHLDFESELLSFPQDCADSESGQIYAEMQSKELQVTRQPPFLIQLERTNQVFQLHSNALVPVKFTQISRGRPKRFSMVCLPNMDDMLAISQEKNAIITETATKTGIIDGSVEKADVKKAQTLEHFIPLDGSAKQNQRLISLNEMFPDQESLKRKRNAKKREKRKVAAKKRKLDTAQKYAENDENITEHNTIEADVNGTCEAKHSVYGGNCSRTVIGRIVRGDYSFVNAQGVSYGYCPTTALTSIKDRIVLIRNSTSKFYHPAKISIHMQQSEL
ncbi:ribonucleases p/MRP protein subunit POP1 domain-containing protein [Ditylenchus destructor]|uniref:Ribonucleases p/MRP protein subunit POP1 domain-containing protein n=1 Tax=Ditylenchus destructor TaxID=166010 RepID=A0AAD4MZD4_9BILA|nr:ribonucleases p/MRP protein subunit POP1 domain-containing protein [Ditylenchus destructor]